MKLTLTILTLTAAAAFGQMDPAYRAPLNASSTNCLTLGSCLSIDPRGSAQYQYNSVGISLTGTWAATVSFEGTMDCSTWFAATAVDVVSGASLTSTTANGSWIAAVTGYCAFRTRVSAYTSGTAQATLRPAVQGSGGGLPAGSVVSGPNLALPGTVSVGTSVPGTAPSNSIAAGGNIYGRIPGSGNRTVFFGDSKTVSGYSLDRALTDADWPRMSQFLSSGQIFWVRNAGVSGNTSAQMLARIQADVIAYQPDKVTILCCTNDILGDVANGSPAVPLSTTVANLTQMVSILRAAGIHPILIADTPRNTNIKEQLAIIQAVRRLARQLSVPLVDFFTPLANPPDGAYATGISADGVHPTAGGGGYRTMAGVLAAAASTLGFPAHSTQLSDCDATNCGMNLLPHPLFLTNVAGCGTNWTCTQTGTGGAFSIVTDTAIVGNWQQVVKTTGTGTAYISLALGAGSGTAHQGHLMAVYGRLSTSGITGDTTADVDISGDTLSDQYPARSWISASTGQYYMEFTYPANGTTLLMRAGFMASSSGVGTFKIAQVGIVDLTAQGLAF